MQDEVLTTRTIDIEVT